MKYLPDAREYPSTDGEILPFGEDWHYVSSTFANAFLNKGKVLAACVINRYSGDPDDLEGRDYRMRNPVSQQDQNVNITAPEDAIQLFEAGWRNYHTDLNIFQDDILMLTKDEQTYCRFWLDRDVSDCSIGRFRTDDPEDDVIQEFFNGVAKCAKQVRNSHDDRPDFWPLRPEWLQGWISW